MRRRTHSYGGQAVIEGVMIRGQHHVSVAVRRPDGSIAAKREQIGQIFSGRLRRLPIIRGIAVLIETLTLGMQALNYSAKVAAGIDDEEMTKSAILSTVAFFLLFAVGVFFVLPALASVPLESVLRDELLSNVAEGAIRLVLFIGYIGLLSRAGGVKRVFMYHGAEHMTVHAHERGDSLTLENVRKYPTAHPRCGTAFLLTVMILSVVTFLFMGREPFWWLIASRIVLIPVIAAISYEIIRLSGKFSANPLVNLITWPNLALQNFTTRQPNDDQIEVAIIAMKNALEADEDRLAEKDSPLPSTG